MRAGVGGRKDLTASSPRAAGVSRCILKRSVRVPAVAKSDWEITDAVSRHRAVKQQPCRVTGGRFQRARTGDSVVFRRDTKRSSFPTVTKRGAERSAERVVAGAWRAVFRRRVDKGSGRREVPRRTAPEERGVATLRALLPVERP
jgi:hypothetical protein